MLYPLLFLFACVDEEKPEATAVKKVSTEQKAPAKAAPKKADAGKPAAPAAGAEAGGANATASTGGNCDAQLKDYSEFVDEYIDLMKKANKGDMSALKKYPALMKKAEKSGKEIQGLHKDGKIDADCWKKYNKINNKMASAAMDMSGASASDKKELKDLQKAQDKAVDQAACMQNCQGKAPAQAAACMQKCM